MEIIVIISKEGIFKGVMRNNDKTLMYWAEDYQAKNGLIGSIEIDYYNAKMKIGSESFYIIFESL